MSLNMEDVHEHKIQELLRKQKPQWRILSQNFKHREDLVFNSVDMHAVGGAVNPQLFSFFYLAFTRNKNVRYKESFTFKTQHIW